MSQFTDNILQPESTGIDFSQATKLPGGGSTCDIYVTTLHRRKVFVKRLKKEFQDMPVYRSAFDKEYDIGVNLKHKSLPEYREFGGDYIVMDYIDGKTLADLLKNKDPWLSKEKNVIRLLCELIEVADYLHQHNITHCDIKPDNIMLTAGNRNLMLIDLDKCYTDWLNDTPGAPSKFGLPIEIKGSMEMDFYCIGLVLEKIKSEYPNLRIPNYKAILSKCKSKDVSADDILEIINDTGSKNKRGKKSGEINPVFLLLLGFLILIGVAIFAPRHEDKVQKTDEPLPSESMPDYIKSKDNIDDDEIQETVAPIEISSQEAKTDPVKELTMEEKGLILDEKYKPFVKKLDVQLAQLQEYQRDTTLSFDDMLDHIQHFADGEDNFVTRMWQLVQETFPETHETDVADQIYQSRVYREYMHRSDSIQKSYQQEMLRRNERDKRNI